MIEDSTKTIQQYSTTNFEEIAKRIGMSVKELELYKPSATIPANLVEDSTKEMKQIRSA